MLYQILSAAFCVIVVLSNIISAKMVQILFISIPAGLITYPFTFLLADLVTEFYGKEQARLMVIMAFGMSLLSFGIIHLAVILPAQSESEHLAFAALFGLSGLRIFSSLTAYLVSQFADVQLYALIKKWTGPKLLWLRSNGSTCISQLIDTVLIDLIYLYWGLSMGWSEVFPIMIFSYTYKAFFSVAITPLFYLSVFLIRRRDHVRFLTKTA